ncbi:MAG: class I poly(R)-hydroxyalkanoic acid synthase [Bdellovibrionales bacterium]
MSIAEESLNPQTGKTLDESLDAVTALRNAMQERLGESKTLLGVEVKKKNPRPRKLKVVQTAEAEPEKPVSKKAAPAKKKTVKAKKAPAAPKKLKGFKELKEIKALVEAKAPPKPKEPEKIPEAKKPEAPVKPKEAKKHEEPSKPKQEEKPTEEIELHFDIVEWTKIMIHVSKGCLGLIRDYIIRTRDKPIDTLSISPTPFMDSFVQLIERFLGNPEAYTEAQLATWQNYIDLTRATVMRLQGHSPKPVAQESASDKRFKAKDWQTNWLFDFLKQSYLSTSGEAFRFVQQEAKSAENKMSKKLEFYSRLFLDACAPNNFWMTNPEVLRATLESKGENLIKGFKNFLQDLEKGNGLLRIRMSDCDAFELGKNIATTPGKVVFQNGLMQLIQYAPQTETVHRTPLLIIPPWINKYYILDLRQKNSFIGYLVAQGYTVFCISWVNPTRRHALTQFEDYLDKGALAALREIKLRTGEEKVNVLGYCIGGTLLSCLQAYLAAAKEKHDDLPKIVSATYLVTMIDFSQPGDLGVFIDNDQIRLIEDRMARLGFLDANSLIMTFNLLRSNDLFWPFIINNYMLGREPFPFDILYWNTDSTNLPAAMQSYYLRRMYLENKLVEPNALRMKNVPLDLGKIKTPSFLISAREDHIAPWRSTYASTRLYKGPVTFVLSGSGHIAGVINPPEANKYGYWTNNKIADNPDEWLQNAEPHTGSWWPEWINWLKPFAGEDVPAREVNEGIEDAPGSYVKVRVV